MRRHSTVDPALRRGLTVLASMPVAMGLAVCVRAFAPATPLGLCAGGILAGAGVLLAALNARGAFTHLRPFEKKIVVGRPRDCAPGALEGARQELQALGFRLMGTQTEEGDGIPMDVFVHETHRTWANLFPSQHGGLAGYFLSTFASGAVVITWSTDGRCFDEDLLHWRAAAGLQAAWKMHLATLAELAEKRGELVACGGPREREEAARQYYRVSIKTRPFRPTRWAYRLGIAGVVLVAVGGAVALLGR